MEKILINSFRKIKQNVITWKSEQRKSDWFAYLFFWIGVIGNYAYLTFSSLDFLWYERIILSIGAGTILEAIYMGVFSIIYLAFFYNKRDKQD